MVGGEGIQGNRWLLARAHFNTSVGAKHRVSCVRHGVLMFSLWLLPMPEPPVGGTSIYSAQDLVLSRRFLNLLT